MKELATKMKQESDKHKKELLGKDLVGATLKHKSTKQLFDQARVKVELVRKEQEAARKAMEDAKVKCEECGEFKLEHKAKQDMAIARGKALEIARAKLEKAKIPKGTVVMKVDSALAAQKIIGEPNRA